MHTRAHAAIRYALAALFLWFGSQQVIDAGSWTGFLPEWLGYLPIPAEMFVQLNGLFEVLAGIMLVLGCYTRVAAFLLGSHLMVIAISVGGAIGVRDAALAACTLALAASPADALTLDARQARRAGSSVPK